MDTLSTMTSRFDRVLDQYLHARDYLNGLPIDTDRAAEELASNAYSFADKQVIDEPATTVAELRAKAEIIWQDNGSSPTPEALLSFFRDLRRLTNNETSRTFNPEAWLAWFSRIGGWWLVREGEALIFGPTENDQIKDALWQLETRGGREAVKALLLARETSRQEA